MVKRQLTPALAASLAANLTPMTANSTPESFDDVLTEFRRCDNIIVVSEMADHLQSAHARELAEHGAALAQALEDSARYRWLRDESENDVLDALKPLFDPREFDAAIDSAIAAQQKEAAHEA